MRNHPFHLVNPSPWPLFASFAVFIFTIGMTQYMHGFIGGGYTLTLGFSMVLYAMYVWWRDIIREATFEGHHTQAVQRGIRYGVILFITSEVMFFVAFFWSFFHGSLAPTIEIGAVWPPKGISVIGPWEVPLLNTFILLSSGASVTWAHHAILAGERKQALNGLYMTIALAVVFTFFQAYEYVEAPFTISDSVYGSTFYMLTGGHGLHVIVGTTFLAICTIRLYNYHFTKSHHLGFEAAALYWHFVDVVWLFLFVVVYWWGGA
jgi:cytochrome c oxidase subunit 3|uniref:Cytochrome c oxidase subunit 3 n=1 Tax=Oltmannsiellopsis viridis TaxID=51324 RepID=Q0QIN6_OLTVI|nr:cytochrome c oxidase subunit 3 [Oltmannsiellopsis viridis]ABC96368.1 cytochrome c oxidase subunit 3 [Oltmannsiellopsis viridis]